MATCNFCKKDMLRAKGCIKIPVIQHGTKKSFSPIKCGDPGDWWFGYPEGTRCPDCNAAVGYYHHPGCDNERCPICGGQLITCGCVADEEDEE